jgi:cyanophycinase-like exopeptidase
MLHAPSTDSSRDRPPVYLLADSELLFWKSQGKPFLDSIRPFLGSEMPKAAYIGASNGDVEEFYSIFEAAMDGIDVGQRRMIRSSPSSGDRDFLKEAHVIVLAGGDVLRGWKIFVETGLREEIIARHQGGAVLIGISAGAVQLGSHAIVEHDESSRELIETFNLVPAIVDVHDEQRDWAHLASTVALLEGAASGIGIPKGGGAIFHPDQSLEAVRRPLHEICIGKSGTNCNLIVPKEPG